MLEAPPASAKMRIPRATYRLQLNAGFNFRDAAALVPYLTELGVSHVYCSPYLRARPGSQHGYDIIDHGAFNPEIGTAADFDHFCAVLKKHGMGQIADIVPNHMGVLGGDNAWWLDVLENGPASAYADYFDIDWQAASQELQNRLLVPVLGDHYGNVLERGELALRFDAHAGTFEIEYYDHRFPLDPRTYPLILEQVSDPGAMAELSAAALAELGGLALLFHNLPRRDQTDPASARRRNCEQGALKKRLAALASQHPPLSAAIARAMRIYSGREDGAAGDSAQSDAMHELLESQAYRLAYWRVASDEINYRRFFDVNHLAGVKIENPAVFEATHRFIFDLIGRGQIDGLRIDHPDGLRDPLAYFQALQDRYAQISGLSGEAGPRLYVVIEKIVASFEALPEAWPVAGTTGYGFANLLNGLYVDGAAEAKMTRTYNAFAGKVPEFSEVAYRARRVVLRDLLSSELTVLANQAARIARADRRTRDYTLNLLRQALAEVIACFPVYRTYIADSVSDVDRRYIDWAVASARRRSRSADATVFDFVRALLRCEAAEGAAPPLARAIREFAAKMQQVTAPTMAKGVEDTAFYVYNRLVSLNDVGGNPELFGVPARSFHAANAEAARLWPHAMLASSTHDNKRSEDVRARIDVLSEMPALWRLQLRHWSRANRSKKREVDGEAAPSRNDEYLLYQTLLGTFPPGPPDPAEMSAYAERIVQYMVKATREAKAETSWLNPNLPYEQATADFVRALLADSKRNLFLRGFREVLEPVARLGRYNSLSMALIKLTAPGVPDIYQGNELWDFSLVDPDNRRAVDYARRRAMLARVKALSTDTGRLGANLREALNEPGDGLAKAFLIWKTLDLRRTREELFSEGSYTPLAAEGERAGHVVAYARRHRGGGALVIAGRLFSALTANGTQPPCGVSAWGATTVRVPFLAEGTMLRHAYTGETLTLAGGCIAVAEAYADFCAAILLYHEGEINAE